MDARSAEAGSGCLRNLGSHRATLLATARHKRLIQRTTVSGDPAEAAPAG